MKKKKEVLEFFGVHLSHDMANTLREHAEIFGRSLSGEIRVLIRDGLVARKEFEFYKPRKK